MNQITALVFVLAIGFIPYSYANDCECLGYDTNQCEDSGKTITDEKGNKLGNCQNPDSNRGQLFAYVKKTHKCCCEANTARFGPSICINYSMCTQRTESKRRLGKR